ncbi:MAG TPA: alpha-1,4-glucan--maltose-1-phosphate maltosyltransferase [Actinomycetota bacterium]|nr:alpha-1,4-glucan--maltose-1-phosphate maltosyltransferase [Actinomycetota bacterium]
MPAADGRRRLAIEDVGPQVDCGRFPIKRTVGETVAVEADVFADGHDTVACELRYRAEGDRRWTDVPMTFVDNDRWRGAFTVTDPGRYRYVVRAWIDRFGTWRRDVAKKAGAGQDVGLDLRAGAELVDRAARRASGEDRRTLSRAAAALASPDAEVELALDPAVGAAMARNPDRRHAVTYARQLEVVVDRERARFSAWYELFPRSAAAEPGRHATFLDVAKRLQYVAEMGFDVVYLPPIHPIGRTNRKGRNNAARARPGDVGSPWAIGGPEGGHTAVHPDLGTIEDFDRLVERAHELDMEIALDYALQCSADHPWLREHPEWFRRRPDGTIAYAENPPKRYEDIYPLDFESEAWPELWEACRGIVEFWVSHGVRIFRVDNPHTKAFPFWEWLIAETKRRHPDVLFLSEAFTRPKVMHRLAKLGFTQSYTYFAWRNTKWELEEYFGRDLPAVAEFFRPNLWPNTPDILTETLQTGGRPAFMARLVLAATLGASYGIYGPAFELMEAAPREPGSEEYRDSEKYQLRHWDLDGPDSLVGLIGRLNRSRRENPALQSDRNLRFHGIDNEQLIAYSKATDDRSNVILTVVNLDPVHVHSGWVHVPLDELRIDAEHPYQVHDVITDSRYLWQGDHGYVELDPAVVPAHVFRVRRRVRSERDYEHFL